MLIIIYLTLFPEYFDNYFKLSLAKKALTKKFISYQTYNLRDFAIKGQVDDYLYGGGAGMLLKIEPLITSLEHIQKTYQNNYLILLSPQGKRFTQNDVPRLINLNKNIVFICGHYEGIDARIFNFINEQLSIGDFVTMGGELPSLTITDALIRAIPDMIKKESYEKESFTKNNRFDFDSYTRPANFRNLYVPKVLLSGNHKEIEKWRNENKKFKEKNKKKQHLNKKILNLNNKN